MLEGGKKLLENLWFSRGWGVGGQDSKSTLRNRKKNRQSHKSSRGGKPPCPLPENESYIYTFRPSFHVRVCCLPNDGQCRDDNFEVRLQSKQFGLCRGFLGLGLHIPSNHLRCSGLLKLVHSIPTGCSRTQNVSHHWWTLLCFLYLTGS